MKFPILLCKSNTIIVVRQDFFDRVGRLDETSGKLDLNVTRDGRAGLNWILDKEGALYRLTSNGLQPAGLLESIGLRRRRESFQIDAAVSVTAGGLIALIADMEDMSPDIPNVSDLRTLLKGLPLDQIITRESLSSYFGE